MRIFHAFVHDLQSFASKKWHLMTVNGNILNFFFPQYFCKEEDISDSDLEHIALKASGYVAHDLKILFSEAKEVAYDRYNNNNKSLFHQIILIY